jgi:hypothetical protein
MPAFVIGGSALVGAGGSIFSSLLGASGTSKSAAAIRYAADQASKTALELNARSRADLKPFRDLGVQSGQMLSDIYSGKANLDQLFKSSSLYQFESDYGTRALNRQLSARGQYNSGAGLESLALFDKSLVAEQGSDYFNKLFGTAQLGEAAAAQTASNATATGNTVAGIQANAGVGIGQGLSEPERGLWCSRHRGRECGARRREQLDKLFALQSGASTLGTREYAKCERGLCMGSSRWSL